MTSRLSTPRAAIAIALVALLVGCRRRPPSPVAPRLAFEKYQLANGLDVILHLDPRVQTVRIGVWYRAGAKDEPPGKAGLAHLVEHLMFRGSRHLGPNDVSRLLAIGGADTEGWTDSDRTIYVETLPASQLELGLWLESSRMGFFLDQPNLEGSLAVQRSVVEAERLLRLGDRRWGLSIATIDDNLYPRGHPYDHSVLGDASTTAALSRADVEQFYLRHYGPNNAALIIAGNFAPARAMALVERYFGPIPRGPAIQPAGPTVGQLSGEVRVALEAPASHAELTVVWATPPTHASGYEEVEILADILGYGSESRLSRRLRSTTELAQAVTVSQSGRLLGSQLTVGIIHLPTVGADELLAIVDEEIARLKREPIGDAELAAAIRRRQSRLIRDLDDLPARTYRLLEDNHLAGDPGHLTTQWTRLDAIKPAGVQEAARRFLTAGRVVIISRAGANAPMAGRLLTRTGPPPSRVAPPNPAAAVSRRSTPDAPFRHRIPTETEVAQPAGVFHQLTLSNGLPVIFSEAHDVPQVRAELILFTGQTSGPADVPRLPSLTMDALLSGPRHRPRRTYERQLGDLSADLSWALHEERTTLSLVAPSAEIEPALSILADVLLHPAFLDEEGQNSRWERSEDVDNPENIGNELMLSRLWGWQGEPGGLRTDLPANADARQVAAFYRRHFRPSNAAMIITGDIELARARALLESQLGSWRAPGGISSPTQRARPLDRQRLILVSVPALAQASVRFILPAPGRFHADHVALSLANEILGGSFKRFERTLRDEKGWAYSVTSALLATGQPGLWFASGRFFYPRTGAAIEYMLEEMAGLGAGDVTAEELADAKRALIMRASRAESDARQVAQRIASRLVFGNPEPDLAAQIRKIAACTREDVVAAAHRTLRPDQVLILVIGDPAALTPTLLRLGPVELWKPTDHTYRFERALSPSSRPRR